MDPDLVRQQEEAEKESFLAALQKPATVLHAVDRVVTAEENTPTSATQQKRMPVYATLGHFVIYCIAGAILGWGIGAAATNLMTFTPYETNVVKLSVAAAIALTLGLISLSRY